MKTSHKFMISIGGGVLVAGAALLYLQSAERKIHAQQKMAVVLVAKRFIPAGKPLKAEDVEERRIPEAYIQPMSLSSLKNSTVRSRRGVMKGEQVTRSNVYEEGSLLGLAWVLSPGQSAVSLALPPHQAVGGHLVPGDRVDVLCVIDRQPDWNEARAFSLLSKARVLTVNEKILDAPPVLGENQKREMANETILVTLELTLEQAARLVLAQEKGRLSLALASPLDSAARQAAETSLRTLKR